MPKSTHKPVLHCKDHRRYSRNCSACVSTSFNGGQQPAPISRSEVAAFLFGLGNIQFEKDVAFLVARDMCELFQGRCFGRKTE